MYSNFANIIKYINLYLKDKNVTFHHEIYDNIKTITNNFETNLTCKDLQDNGLNINHLNYLAYHYCQVNKNTFFLTLWPIVNRNYEDIIMKYYNDNNCKIIFKKDLQLNDNLLTDEIPPEIGNMTSIIKLNLKLNIVLHLKIAL